MTRHGEHGAADPLDGVVGTHPAQGGAGGHPRRHEVGAGAEHLERRRARRLVVDVPECGAAEHRALGERPGTEAVADQLGQAQPLVPPQVEARLVAPPEQLEQRRHRADRQAGARGQLRGERGVQGRRLPATTGVVPREQPRHGPSVAVDEGAGLGDRAEPDRPDLHVSRGGHQVGEQPVDGRHGIPGVALAPLRTGPLPGRGQRGPRDHAAGTVERHRLGHGGPEIDADVDGRGHLPRNLGMPAGSVNDGGHTRRAISVPGRRACIVPGRRTASPGSPVHTSSGWRNWQTR